MGFMFLIYVFCIDLFVGFYMAMRVLLIYIYIYIFFKKDRKSLNIREDRVPCVSYGKI
jgi:Ca2+/Na+ antiporter